MPSNEAQSASFDKNAFQAIIPGASQMLAVGGSSAQSTALATNTTIVRLFSTVDCFVAIGANPTAAADTTMFLPGGITEYVGCKGGDLVATIQSDTAGSLYITEGA